MVINLRNAVLKTFIALGMLAILVVSNRLDNPLSSKVNGFRDYLLNAQTDLHSVFERLDDIREIAPKALARKRSDNRNDGKAKVEIKSLNKAAVPAVSEVSEPPSDKNLDDEQDDLPRDDIKTEEQTSSDKKLDKMPDGKILTPVNGVVSNGFGERVHPILRIFKLHKGIDIAASEGSPVAASLDGVVYRAGRAGTLGLAVYIKHDGDRHSVYGHLSKIEVKVGQHVKRGDEIGLVGKTGLATGPHLHFEYWLGDVPKNPVPLMVKG